jgi:metal-responsive CopG/Arc/MetJ family transcriptional regulator
MPTKKPVIQTVIEENIYNKFKEICKKEDRSESKMAAIIIKKYIEQYEQENGRINNLGVSVTKTG